MITLQDAINEVVVDPEIRTRSSQLGMEVVGGSAETFSSTILQGLVTLAKVAEAANIKLGFDQGRYLPQVPAELRGL